MFKLIGLLLLLGFTTAEVQEVKVEVTPPATSQPAVPDVVVVVASQPTKLPATASAPAASKPAADAKTLVVRVTMEKGDPVIAIDGNEIGDAKEMLAAMRTARKTMDKVRIVSDESVAWKWVVEVSNAATMAGFDKVMFGEGKTVGPKTEVASPLIDTPAVARLAASKPSSQPAADAKTLVIRVTADKDNAVIKIGEKEIGDPKEMLAALRAARKTMDKVRIVTEGDPKWKWVVEVSNAATMAGFDKVDVK